MGRPASILVVEDDADMRALLHAYLKGQGYLVQEAGNGDEALAILNGEGLVDLLLADIVMPGSRDGIALAAEARRIRPGLKVLHVTGYPQRLGDQPHFVRSGGMIRKPVERRDLLARVADLLGRWAVDQNEVLQRAFHYWSEKAAGRPYPQRQDLDPSEIKYLLPYISIYERTGAPPRFRCRLAGTKVVAAAGANLAGRFVDEIMPEDGAQFIERQLDQVISSGFPLYTASNFRAAQSDMSTERLLLPFGTDAGDVQVVVVQTFNWGERPLTLHEIALQHPQRTHAVQSAVSPLKEAS
jgi:DNA-binding response OmpR family regulator